MPTQIEKLDARANHLLDGLILLRQRYAILDPMLFDAAVIQTRGGGDRVHGFLLLQLTLFLVCAQDIAKLTCDSDDKAPSLRNIVDVLRRCPDVVTTLREQYSGWCLPSGEFDSDPEMREVMLHVRARRQDERRQEFDAHLADLLRSFDELASSPEMLAFRNARDKVTAHTEVRLVADKYVPVQLRDLPIRWGDVADTIAKLQHCVELVGFVVRSSGFAWDHFQGQLDVASRAFWAP